MKLINDPLIENVVLQAKNSPRRRMNYNFHETLDDRIQRMLNVLEPGSYVQPHKHEDPDKFEAFLIIRGRLLIVEFDDLGEVKSTCILSADEGFYGAEIAPRTWHSIIALEPCVVYELKDGPYSPLNDKNFAPWAPKEGTPGCSQYLADLLKRCALYI